MNTKTTYLGLHLEHPFIVGASPLGAHFDAIRRLEDGGCAAIVLHSLFEEQITLSETGRIRHMDPLDPQFADILSGFPTRGEYPLSPDAYAEHLRRVKAAVRIPVIASLNGTTGEAWLKFGRVLEQAGADALEMNVYDVVTNLNAAGLAIESHIRDVVGELKRALKIPVAVKLSAYFTAFGNLAKQLSKAGAAGLVIFNRFYQPDIDIDAIAVRPTIDLSTSAELRLRLQWLAILYGRLPLSLGVTGGVLTPADGVKALLAGADAVQMVSAILRHGPSYFGRMRDGLAQWMETHAVESLDGMRGRVSLHKTTDPWTFERANYIRTLQSWT